MCTQLGLDKKISDYAVDLLSKYKIAAVVDDTDLTHPQYSAMAIFQSCKKQKVKINKTKLIALSHLQGTQWINLEKKWIHLLPINELTNSNVKSTEKLAESIFQWILNVQSK